MREYIRCLNRYDRIKRKKVRGEREKMENIAILGSTGSIGVNTLNVVSHLKDRFKVVALSADSNIKSLSEQARTFSPKLISVGSASLVKAAVGLVPSRTKIVFGMEGLKEIVARADVSLIVFAIGGRSCLIPLLEAIRMKKRIALANKESLVSAGSILISESKKRGVKIIPIDSEHSAIFQCLEGKQASLAKIYLTGSGGPLLGMSKDRFDKLPQKFILRHPKWKMGKKISVDSATMMNKGLETIEAKYLFGIDEKFIEVLIHPEAIIHSMVELIDGSIFAQLGMPDMRLPIQYALTYPDRVENMLERVDFSKTGSFSFSRPDIKKFPCLGLARQAAREGGTSPAVLCAADEETVKNYLDERINFSDIPKVIEKVLARHKNVSLKPPTINDILEAEGWAVEEARSICYR